MTDHLHSAAPDLPGSACTFITAKHELPLRSRPLGQVFR